MFLWYVTLKFMPIPKNTCLKNLNSLVFILDNKMWPHLFNNIQPNCLDTLPKVCDDDYWVPTGKSWSMESTIPLMGSN